MGIERQIFPSFPSTNDSNPKPIELDIYDDNYTRMYSIRPCRTWTQASYAIGIYIK